MSLLNLMLKMIIIPVYQNESNEANNDVDDHNSSHRSLAMRAMREDAESVAASRSVRRTAVVTAA